MAFEALKARVGLGGRHRQYVNIETVRDLEDISDPESVEDDSKSGFREWASTHPVLATILGAVGLIVVVIFLFWMTRIVPGMLTNPLLWKAGAVGIFGVFAYRKGWKGHRKRVSDWDELELMMDGKAVSYKGVYLDDFPGKADGFIPIKGWRKGGHQAIPYKNAELGAALVESFNTFRMKDDAASVIRLKPTEAEVTHTDWGTRVVQRTGGLEPDREGEHTTLECTLPDYDDDRANELAEQLEQVTDDYYDAMGEVQGLQRRIANLKDRLNEPIDEEVQKRIREHQDMRSAIHGDQRQRQTAPSVGPRPRDDFIGTGTLENGHKDSEIEEVEEELTNDD